MIIKFFKFIFTALFGNFIIRKHIANSPYATTLYNVEWLKSNHDKLMDMLPDTWTHCDNIDLITLGIKLSVLDVPWKTRDDILGIIGYLEFLGLLIRKNGYQIVRNPDNKFAQAAELDK